MKLVINVDRSKGFPSYFIFMQVSECKVWWFSNVMTVVHMFLYCQEIATGKLLVLFWLDFSFLYSRNVDGKNLNCGR